MEFSSQEYWSGLPFPSPGDLPDPGIEPGSPALQADSLLSESPGKQIVSVHEERLRYLLAVGRAGSFALGQPEMQLTLWELSAGLGLLSV